MALKVWQMFLCYLEYDHEYVHISLMGEAVRGMNGLAQIVKRTGSQWEFAG